MQPTKPTPDIQGRIVEALESGNYLETALRFAGISPATFKKWMARGAKARDRKKIPKREKPFVDLLEAVEQAEATVEVYAVATLRKTFSTSWRAAMAWLQHRHPERWATSAERKNASSADEARAKEDEDPFAELDELAERRAAKS